LKGIQTYTDCGSQVYIKLTRYINVFGIIVNTMIIKKLKTYFHIDTCLYIVPTCIRSAANIYCDVYPIYTAMLTYRGTN